MKCVSVIVMFSVLVMCCACELQQQQQQQQQTEPVDEVVQEYDTVQHQQIHDIADDEFSFRVKMYAQLEHELNKIYTDVPEMLMNDHNELLRNDLKPLTPMMLVNVHDELLRRDQLKERENQENKIACELLCDNRKGQEQYYKKTVTRHDQDSTETTYMSHPLFFGFENEYVGGYSKNGYIVNGYGEDEDVETLYPCIENHIVSQCKFSYSQLMAPTKHKCICTNVRTDHERIGKCYTIEQKGDRYHPNIDHINQVRNRCRSMTSYF